MEVESVLIVDDDPGLRGALARGFRVQGLRVLTAADYSEAVALVERERPALAVVDLNLGFESGLDVLRGIKALEPATAVLMLTGYPTFASAVDAIHLGAISYLPKPASPKAILAELARKRAEMPSSLSGIEEAHILRVLAECGGNRSDAARRLGIDRRTLQRRLSRSHS